MILLDPNQTAEFTLEEFEGADGKPVAGAPVFIAGAMTARQFMAYQRLLREHDDGDGTIEEKVAKLIEALRLALRGWKRVTLPDGSEQAFAIDALPDVMQYGQMIRLAVKAGYASQLGRDDRKKSRSPAGSETAPSVEGVASVVPGGG